MLSIKSPSGCTRAKLLFLMGATWHNHSMFDLSTVDDSFSNLLNRHGIETYSFDIYGVGTNKLSEPIGNRHNDNINLAIQTIKNYNIDYVMAYSYGCTVAEEAIKNLNVKGIIFLDPFAKLLSSKSMIDNDIFLFKKENIINDIRANGGIVNQQALDDHLSALFGFNDQFTSAVYPGLIMSKEKQRLVLPEQIKKLITDKKVLTYFTKNSVESIRNLYANSTLIYNQNASHWIMIEPQKYHLADTVNAFISKTNV